MNNSHVQFNYSDKPDNYENSNSHHKIYVADFFHDEYLIMLFMFRKGSTKV